jgi:transcription-repair coupling factor (superfamily II helicase)
MIEQLTSIFKYQDNTEVIGLTEELDVFYVLNYFKQSHKSLIVLTSDLYQANYYYDHLATYEEHIAFFPMDDFITSVALAISPEFKLKRLETLQRVQNGEALIIVTNLMGFLHFLPQKDLAPSLNFNLKKGLELNRNKFLETLNNFGYQRESIVTSTGEYAVRGFVIDVFLVNENHPLRIEFFGDEIESIRYFDENTQLSINEIPSIVGYPITEIKTKQVSSLLDYLDNPALFIVEQVKINDEYQKIVTEVKEYQVSQKTTNKLMFSEDDLKSSHTFYLNQIAISNKYLEYHSQNINNFNSNFNLLSQQINNWLKKSMQVIFYLSRDQEIKEIKELFPNQAGIKIVKQKINNGFIINNLVIIGENDIENIYELSIKYKNNLKIGKKIHDFNQLDIGDYVVHYSHGIGIYGGVKTLEKNGLKKDYLLINYAGNDKVYVPVEKIASIYKYATKDADKPHIAKLNSPVWNKTKSNLKKHIHDISQELLKLYQTRREIKGPIFKADSLEEIFASSFSYELTPDQIKSTNDILNDLAMPVPMDRLLCGDVGFGKTEVAFRAMFRTVINGYQVAYLCPTTILSNQQYQNALIRFKDFPINIALLNRFTTPKEVHNIIDGLKTGKIDIVFGTHRLLSSDVKYQKLGLLVVDEEQRFGVTHKEKIKAIKQDVNVLTLSATPIPRTLKMALAGLRDLSIIDTAPVNRYPVETYVIADNDLIIKDAIYKELIRQGQVFILYNKVASIDNEMAAIKKLVPTARIVYAHGQMSKQELEQVMTDFINYKYDILLCTTIIETGIDIPNVNTLIIKDADLFGLSQLYQLRGRVGRSNRIAYAYLMYNKNKMLNDIAIKRLATIKEFTELGSGYRIAMRDLALRGAGNILGSEQAGFVDAVGLDLYLKFIDDEIKQTDEVETNDDNVSLIDVETHISNEYVSDEDLKIEIHKQINEIDSYESLMNTKNELEDRFGKITDNMEIYMYEEWFEKLSQKLNITDIKQDNRNITIFIPENIAHKIKFDKLFVEAYQLCNKFSFKTRGGNVIINLSLIALEKHFIYYLVALFNLIADEITKNN